MRNNILKYENFLLEKRGISDICIKYRDILSNDLEDFINDFINDKNYIIKTFEKTKNLFWCAVPRSII